ncbi:MAG: glycoside hydrolase family 13 protein [Phycisphaerae bacterium]|nr:glycoside hydrolase family 13 protein [Phycisphaerae bacterium]
MTNRNAAHCGSRWARWTLSGACLAVAVGGYGCYAIAGQESRQATDTSGWGPGWVADAVWYQVFVSRFCNGNAANDPPATLPWADNWAKLEAAEQPPLRRRLFARRYGGDLQGVRSKFPYLRALGVNVLYLNPIFDATSQHKYDTRDHRHVDDSYGIANSRSRLTLETQDPATWKWTDSDLLFVDFLAQAHRQGLRIVLDGVFNHVGPEFWAWRDVKANGRESAYADWFAVTDWGPPLHWRAWDGPDGCLVNFRHFGDGLHPEVEAYLFAVVRRWMDPDGDGDPSDGIDGWRLDAAEKLPHGFWRRFRQEVKRINPQAVIIGEIWTDPGAWLNNADQFDTVTNYRFSGPVIRFFSQDGSRYLPGAFVEDLAVARRGHPHSVNLGMLNLLGSHDTERAVTMLADPQRLRDPSGKIPKRDLLKPDEDAYRRLKLAALFQFTYPGSPIIYYGDEVGMYGGDDPFCRAPMWWRESSGLGYRVDVLRFHEELIRLRKTCPELRRGRFHLLLADDARRLVVFSRRYRGRETVVVVNGDIADHLVVLTLSGSGMVANCKTLSTSERGRAAIAHVSTLPISPDSRLETLCPALCGQLIRISQAGQPWGCDRFLRR